jgi:DNA/RNA endonuclease YhcR with UshA esterase domain
MRSTLALIAAGLWLVTAASSVHAHHSFAAEYDVTQPITLKGEVQQVDFVNPHGWIYIKVPEPNGKVETWNVEMGSPSTLNRRGFTKDTVAKGTEVVVNGYRAKDGSRTVNGTNVTLPDGRRLFTGSSGTGAPVQ